MLLLCSNREEMLTQLKSAGVRGKPDSQKRVRVKKSLGNPALDFICHCSVSFQGHFI